ncbi:MAG: pyridoxine 4-dehydrogenase [Solirubrobacteraceae bacterium]|jgi:aryl-alcohol dehydrogenase-like predicted oxidoreductase|nr:pyridoxine 4-dehydrogenase [Solirubrobacteraceae bacterium]
MTTNQTATLGAHTVNRIGFGAMQLAGPGVFGPPRDPNAARAVLRRAIELGVDHIDTSQYYGPDVVNELIRETLAPYPPGLRIVSKVGGKRDDAGAWLPAQLPEELRSGVEENLATLGVESLAAVNLRLMDSVPGGAGPLVPLAEQLGTMEDLRREGKIEAIGISSAERASVEQALELADLACVQNAFSIMHRDAQDVLELCAERGIAFVPFFPLGSAFTGGPAAIAADPQVIEVAAKHGVSASQVALAWLLHRDPHILLIPGTSSVTHLEENLGAAAVTLDDEDMNALEHVRQVGNPLEAVQD